MLNKNFIANFVKNKGYFLIGLVLSCLVLWPLTKPGYFSHHDDVQVIRLYEMDKCIKDGQIPCRWVPDLGGGYGYPLFNYYAPLPYYIGEIFYLIVGDFLIAAKLMFVFSFVLAYVFMYLLGSVFWGRRGGSLSAIFYAYIPYHAVNMYVRGAIGELWAMAFFPLILYSLYRLAKKTNFQNLIGFAISLALLITSHNLSTMLFFPAVVIFCLIFYFGNKNFKFIKYAILSIIISFLLTSFYWLPSAMEGKYVHLETMTVGYFSYTEHFKGLRKLFLDRTWGWGSSIREYPGSEKDQMPYQIGIVHLFGLLISLIGSIFLYKGKNKKSVLLVLGSCAFFILLSIFMIHPRSVNIWKIFDPLLKYLQFPWRFLILISFFISFASGAIFMFIKGKTKLVLWLVLVILVTAMNFSYFKPEKFIGVTESDYLSGTYWEKQIKRSIFDYLPIYAKMPPRDLVTVNYQIIEGKAEVTEFNKGTNWIDLEINAETTAKIMLSQYYFPGWEVEINGEKTAIDYNNDLGLMTIGVEPGNSLIKVELHNSMVRTIGNGLSLVSIFGLVGVSIWEKNKKKQK